MDYEKDLTRAKSNKEKNKKLTRQLQKGKPKAVDQQFHALHEQVFEEIDCLKCANCCKTTSPIFRDVDIRRIAQHLRVSEADFIQNNLKLDEENDYVLKTSPCLFLQEDNKCSIYDVRPLACREYPHTNRKNMFQILNLTYTNSLICPAVARIFERWTCGNRT
jgi:Fe-S-cluster containining protein